MSTTLTRRNKRINLQRQYNVPVRIIGENRMVNNWPGLIKIDDECIKKKPFWSIILTNVDERKVEFSLETVLREIRLKYDIMKPIRAGIKQSNDIINYGKMVLPVEDKIAINFIENHFPRPSLTGNQMRNFFAHQEIEYGLMVQDMEFERDMSGLNLDKMKLNKFELEMMEQDGISVVCHMDLF